MTYGLHKDRKPEKTIGVVMNAVSEMGIDLQEAHWNSFSDSHYSVAVYDRGVGMVATNGKGVTREYTLASACAEFMERLQNGYLYRMVP